LQRQIVETKEETEVTIKENMQPPVINVAPPDMTGVAKALDRLGDILVDNTPMVTVEAPDMRQVAEAIRAVGNRPSAPTQITLEMPKVTKTIHRDGSGRAAHITEETEK
jgi:hypothetical protein